MEMRLRGTARETSKPPLRRRGWPAIKKANVNVPNHASGPALEIFALLSGQNLVIESDLIPLPK